MPGSRGFAITNPDADVYTFLASEGDSPAVHLSWERLCATCLLELAILRRQDMSQTCRDMSRHVLLTCLRIGWYVSGL
jgi:hypothetical protein